MNRIRQGATSDEVLALIANGNQQAMTIVTALLNTNTATIYPGSHEHQVLSTLDQTDLRGQKLVDLFIRCGSTSEVMRVVDAVRFGILGRHDLDRAITTHTAILTSDQQRLMAALNPCYDYSRVAGNADVSALLQHLSYL
jgi:hypothetical protein